MHKIMVYMLIQVHIVFALKLYMSSFSNFASQPSDLHVVAIITIQGNMVTVHIHVPCEAENIHTIV